MKWEAKINVLRIPNERTLKTVIAQKIKRQDQKRTMRNKRKVFFFIHTKKIYKEIHEVGTSWDGSGSCSLRFYHFCLHFFNVS